MTTQFDPIQYTTPLPQKFNLDKKQITVNYDMVRIFNVGMPDYIKEEMPTIGLIMITVFYRQSMNREEIEELIELNPMDHAHKIASFYFKRFSHTGYSNHMAEYTLSFLDLMKSMIGTEEHPYEAVVSEAHMVKVVMNLTAAQRFITEKSVKLVAENGAVVMIS